MSFRFVLIPVLVQFCAWAEAPARPVCAKQTRGEIWRAHTHSPCESVEICTLSVWKYKWEPATVSFSQLARDRKHRVACDSAEPIYREPQQAAKNITTGTR